MPELLAVLALVGIAVAIAFLYVTPAAAPLQTAGAELTALLRQARTTAIATGSSYRVFPAAADELVGEYAENCAAASWTLDDDVALELRDGVTLSDTSWSVCFTARGVADSNLSVTLTHPDLGSEVVEVLRGGLARVVP